MSDTALTYAQNITPVETLTAAEMPSAANESARQFTYAGLNRTGRLSSTTTPAVEVPPGYQKITIGAGTTTIDLTAMPSARDPDVAEDYTAKKLIGVRIRAASGNSGNVTVAPGSSNPYPLFGATNEVDVVPGEQIDKLIASVASSHPAVSGTVKTIDVTGTLNDVVDIMLLFGT